MTGRSILIACVTLCHACDAKEKKEAAPTKTGSAVVEQSKEAAISLICDPSYWPKFEDAPPAERAQKLAAWMKEKITNPEVVAFMGSLGNVNPAEREAKIKELAKANNVTYCEPGGEKSMFDELASSVVLPQVEHGDRLPDQGWTIVATERGITIEGQSIEPIENGAIPASSLEAGGKPVRVAQLLAKLAETAHSTGRSFESLHLVMHDKLPVKIAVQLALAAPESIKREVLVVRTPKGTAGLPFTLSRTGDGMLLWLQLAGDGLILNAKGVEKPMFEGKLDGTGAYRAPLRTVLADVVAKTKAIRIDISVAADHTIAQLADLIATVRAADAEGKPLMTDVRLLDPSVAPKDDTPTLEAEIVANHAPLKKCFQQSLTRDGPTQGHKIEVQIAVDDKGAITETKIGGDKLPPALEKCLLAATKTWKLKVKAGKYKFPLVMKPA
jgi:hypothetical protein